jgi:uncharacterized protein (TIGR02996 family)
MTTDEQALLAAVFADPESDAPRLVYADWLDEHGYEAGRARAEFIRLQIRLAQLGEWHPSAPAIWDRSLALYDSHGKAWVAEPECPQIRMRYLGGCFERGFLDGETLHLSHDDFDRPDSTGWLAGRPLFRLELGRWEADLTAIVDWPESPRVRGLSFCSDCDRPADFAAKFLRSARLPRLRELDLGGEPDDALRVVAEDPRYHTLRELRLCGRDHEAAAVVRLLSSRNLSSLTRLTLSQGAAPGPALDRLATVAFVPRLTGLHLSRSSGGGGRLLAVLRRLDPGRLSALALRDCGLTDATADALARLPLRALTELDVGNNRLSPAALGRMLASRLAGRVRALWLRGLPLAGGLNHLPWPDILGPHALDLSDCGLTADDLAVLLRWDGLSSVRSLLLNDNPIGDRGAELLAGCPLLASLRQLSCSRCDLTESGARVLARAPFGRRISWHELSMNPISADWLYDTAPGEFGWGEADLPPPEHRSMVEMWSQFGVNRRRG